MNNELRTKADIDFAKVELGYEEFRQLATNLHLTPHERIGFPSNYREGFEADIFTDILSKLPDLTTKTNLTIIDIGPGCAGLPRMLIELCTQRQHNLILCDSEEMLAQLPDVPNVTSKIPGMFPKNAGEVSALAPKADAILCYSTLHYIFVETNLYSFFDAFTTLLAPEGRALIGDIPNVSKRRRFFASDTGRQFHKEFVGRDEEPPLDFNMAAPGKIDDAVLNGLIQRLQASGFDAYVLPQAKNLPMANRRDDLLVIRP